VETLSGSVYDYPKYYDVLFGADWKAEYQFLLACFRKHADGRVSRLLEPACGTGRLLVKFAQAGYGVTGNDLNPKAVDYCNRRLVRHGFPPTAEVADMADFRLPQKVDAAFNTINSFRHLSTEEQAENHLQCIADSLTRGGIYILGLHLTPTWGRPSSSSESWTARRGRLVVRSRMWTTTLDRRLRQERSRFRLDLQTPGRRLRLDDELVFRTYTAGQFQSLLDRVPELERVADYDFGYRIDQPIRVGAETEDVVVVLRRR
jgi:SAM-dependent methyltransferase